MEAFNEVISFLTLQQSKLEALLADLRHADIKTIDNTTQIQIVDCGCSKVRYFQLNRNESFYF